MTLGQTPSQTVGPFFAGAMLPRPMPVELGSANGPPVRLTVRVLDGTGAGVSDALVEVWQADPGGHYAHPSDPGHELVPDGFTGFGRYATDETGAFVIDTLLPGPVHDPDGNPQAPHLNLTVFARGLLAQLCTRVYFPGDPANATDPVVATVPAGRRETLVAHPVDGGLGFDVVLQGDHETVFFDV